MSTSDIPRRNRLDQLTPAEKAIHKAIELVEELGADPLLTNAVIRLGEAKEFVADYIDMKTKKTILVTFVYQAQTDGDVLLKTVDKERAGEFEKRLREKGLTPNDYAIISGHVLKSFDSAGGYAGDQ